MSGFKIQSETSISASPPPEGYQLVDKKAFTAQQLADLVFDAAPDWGQQSVANWQLQINNPALTVLGLVDRTGALAAAGTMLITRDRKTATLPHVVTGTAHRHQGLGRYLVAERVRRADALGIEKIHAAFRETNTMIPFYKELGFLIMPTSHMGVRYRPGTEPEFLKPFLKLK
jgi:GNAT superfamily N-acetyltransferase